MCTLRLFEPTDWAQVWAFLEPVFRAGETYVYPRDISQQQARFEWTEKPQETFVVESEGEILGSYYLKPNQPGQGAHVCNCGYVVAKKARGRGLASRMCEHSLSRARELGYRAMQYNLVVATNEGAIRLWERHGFKKVGRLPQAFLSPTLGYVDAFVMVRSLHEQ